MLTHDIMKELNKTFLTPIDREDIHALASRIDDVLDLLWAATDRMMVYRIDKPTPEAISIAEDLQMTADVLKKALRELRAKSYSHVQEHCIEVNRLENRIDRKYRDALGKLVNGPPILSISSSGRTSTSSLKTPRTGRRTSPTSSKASS